MSRKWERQVERNAKRVNAQRKRMGQAAIGDTVKRKVDNKHQGRSIILPVLLLLIGLSYMVMFWSIDRSGLYWVTVGSYVLLALIIFFIRRPFLTIEKHELTTRKFAGFKTVQAADIEEIEVQKGYVIISLRSKKPKWVFTRSINRFNTDELANKLQEFAKNNQVTFIER